MHLTRRTLGIALTLCAFSIAMAVAFRASAIHPLDDHFLYQSFIEELARGKLNLTIAGFHGSDFMALPWYMLSQSPIAQIQVLIVWALLLPFLAYGAAWRVTKQPLLALIFSGCITLLPFVSFVALRGWTGPAYWGLMFLALFCTPWPILAGAAFGLAVLTKPFAIGLLPLLLYLSPRKTTFSRYGAVGIGCTLVLLYMVVQYFQAGHLLVGAHHGVNETNMWPGFTRLFLNAAHGVQILFSVHNFYFPNPALTGQGNLLHTTPVLMFLGLFGLLDWRRYFANGREAAVLSIGAALAFALTIPQDHMDHFYMEAGVLLLTFASLRVLAMHPVWVPIALATLHFQWFYFFLNNREVFSLSFVFFVVPTAVDVLFVLWCVAYWRIVRDIILSPFRGQTSVH